MSGPQPSAIQTVCCGEGATSPGEAPGAGTKLFWGTTAAEDGICLATGLAWGLCPRPARDSWSRSPPRLCSRSEEALRDHKSLAQEWSHTAPAGAGVSSQGSSAASLFPGAAGLQL